MVTRALTGLVLRTLLMMRVSVVEHSDAGRRLDLTGAALGR